MDPQWKGRKERKEDFKNWIFLVLSYFFRVLPSWILGIDEGFGVRDSGLFLGGEEREWLGDMEEWTK